MQPCEFEELGHTAEIGLRIRAATPEQLFACAGVALFALTGAVAKTVEVEQAVTVESPDVESLLVDWLSELVYLYETGGCAFHEIEVTEWSPQRLAATLRGGRPSDPPRLHVKAVTYHDLAVRASGGEWEAQIYLDI
jgi:SHS2 domain-containing protein